MTAAFGAGKDTIDIGYDVAGLSVYLDYIHMMCYDYHGAWDQKTGANAPLKSADDLNVVNKKCRFLNTVLYTLILLRSLPLNTC